MKSPQRVFKDAFDFDKQIEALEDYEEEEDEEETDLNGNVWE